MTKSYPEAEIADWAREWIDELYAHPERRLRLIHSLTDKQHEYLQHLALVLLQPFVRGTLNDLNQPPYDRGEELVIGKG